MPSLLLRVFYELIHRHLCSLFSQQTTCGPQSQPDSFALCNILSAKLFPMHSPVTAEYAPHVRFSSELCLYSVIIIYKLYMNRTSELVENSTLVCILACKRSKQMKEIIKWNFGCYRRVFAIGGLIRGNSGGINDISRRQCKTNLEGVLSIAVYFFQNVFFFFFLSIVCIRPTVSFLSSLNCTAQSKITTFPQIVDSLKLLNLCVYL